MQKVLIDYEDADNTSEIANNIDVTEIDVTEMAGSSNEQHTETQACKDADELSTKNVSMHEEMTRVESEAKRAQTVVDPKADYETAVAVMANGGTNLC
jgi:hypothetical protein